MSPFTHIRLASRIMGIAFIAFISCRNQTKISIQTEQAMETTDSLHFKSAYAEVNGLNMYYEEYGEGKPFVLIHGGGSTIQSCFEQVIPLFAQNYRVIAVELQAHGRTEDRGVPSSFEQDADDVVKLLEMLGIEKADFFGFSNGATTAMQIAIRHPEKVNKLVLGSPLAKRTGVPDWFWGFMENVTLEDAPAQLNESFLKVNPSQEGLQIMHDRDATRMREFKDIPDTQIQSISAPTLIVIGDKDIITPEHALQLNRMIEGSELAILPGGHGAYMGEITTLQPGFKPEDFVVVTLIDQFLNKK